MSCLSRPLPLYALGGSRPGGSEGVSLGVPPPLAHLVEITDTMETPDEPTHGARCMAINPYSGKYLISSGLCKATLIRLSVNRMCPAGSVSRAPLGPLPQGSASNLSGRPGRFLWPWTTESIDRFSLAVYDRCTINPVVQYFRCFWIF